VPDPLLCEPGAGIQHEFRSSGHTHAHEQAWDANQRHASRRLGQKERESTVMHAVGELPPVTALLRQGIGIPHSTVARILRRLEHRGVIHLQRKKP